MSRDRYFPVNSSGLGGIAARESPFDLPRLTAALPRRLTVPRLVWFFVGVGVLLRLARYLLCFPLWCDEYQLAANLLDRDFAGLLQPLDHNQVAPIGFLWIELAATRIFGFSELSLRLFPALCGVASMFLFQRVSRQILAGVPLVLAMAIFAVAYYPIRHSAEVKPYASDLFVSLALLAVALNWWRELEKSRWLWLLAGIAPLALSISFTAAFICGGLSVGIAWTLWQRRCGRTEWKARIGWLAFNLAVAAAFLGLMRLNISAQYDATQREMTSCWADGFPPWQQPMQLALWLVTVHTGEMFAYPAGAENGGSIATFACFAVALASMLYSGRREVALTVIGCFTLSLIAAGLHRYPYGSHARLSQYLAPAICLLAGSGAAILIARLGRIHWQRAAVRGVLGLCGLMAVVMLARDATHPYKTATDRDHRAFAARFWNEAQGAETVCLDTDLKKKAYEGSFETAYRCYQRIYAPAHHAGSADTHGQLAADRPVRCVAFHSASAKRDDRVFDGWMQEMLIRYDLVATQTHHIPLSTNRNQLYDYYLQCYDVYVFAPKPGRQSGDSHDPIAGEPSSAIETSSTYTLLPLDGGGGVLLRQATFAPPTPTLPPPGGEGEKPSQ
ncbi:MAG: hypothetical protein EXS05_07830 [Planctomycetaceae bacterium]|nr:hypothetical protein [Planctomycetaceae bacterium]